MYIYIYALLRSSRLPQALFFSAKMAFLRFCLHVLALLRSSQLPQAFFFFVKKDVPRWILNYGSLSEASESLALASGAEEIQTDLNGPAQALRQGLVMRPLQQIIKSTQTMG